MQWSPCLEKHSKLIKGNNICVDGNKNKCIVCRGCLDCLIKISTHSIFSISRIDGKVEASGEWLKRWLGRRGSDRQVLDAQDRARLNSIYSACLAAAIATIFASRNTFVQLFILRCQFLGSWNINSTQKVHHFLNSTWHFRSYIGWIRWGELHEGFERVSMHP